MAPHVSRLRGREAGIMVSSSLAILAASAFEWMPLSMTEVLGFVTGGICVWLVVREHTWTWPLGIANNVFFFALFLKGRLYADMVLQVVYLILGAYGWWQWLHGGHNRSALSVTRTSRVEWAVLALAAPISLLVLRTLLIRLNGAAPTGDAVTTILSLVAQYLMCRKRIESWWFWILADIIYVPLYVSRDLPLTALLYGIFLVMCVAGWRAWHGAWLAGEARGITP